MHPAAWVAWVLLVMVVALATTNPLYLAILLLGVILVAVLSPRTGTGVTSFRALLLFGVSMMGVSILVATINGNYGEHILFTIPGPEVTDWLGGLRLGGPVSAEGLVWAVVRGMVILPIFLAFGVFNGAVSPHRVLRSTPAALFHASLVVTVGLTLLPSSIEDLRRIREMRALRGAPGGWRDLPALVVPAVIGGLERSMRLAEAMEARGYASSGQPPMTARLAAAASAPLFTAAAWSWFYTDGGKPVGATLALLGAAGIGWWLFAASRTHSTTRFADEPIPVPEKVAIAASAGIALATLALRALDLGALSYNAFDGLPAPEFSVIGAGLVLACSWPALLLALAPGPRAAAGRAEAPRPAEATR